MEKGISIEELARLYPCLYHMAEDGSWPSIKEYGLLSTHALLDLFEVPEKDRERIEFSHRPENIEVVHPRIGKAVIRDQKPMNDEGLVRALRDNLSPRDWYVMLNQRVFFWLTKERLNKLLSARAYRNRPHTVLVVDTKKLAEAHAGDITLSPINTGATKPFPQPRGRDSFSPLDEYPFAYWYQKRHGKDPIVELSVLRSVPKIADFVIRVEEGVVGEVSF